jgi:LysR substrate binding domain
MTAPLLRDFRAAHPRAVVHVRRLHAERIVAALLDGSIDVALLHGPVDDERIDVLPLFSEPRVAAVSAAGELSEAAHLPVADLLTRPARTRRPECSPTGRASSPSSPSAPASSPIARATGPAPRGAALRHRARRPLPHHARAPRPHVSGRVVRGAVRAAARRGARPLRGRDPPTARPAGRGVPVARAPAQRRVICARVRLLTCCVWAGQGRRRARSAAPPPPTHPGTSPPPARAQPGPDAGAR